MKTIFSTVLHPHILFNSQIQSIRLLTKFHASKAKKAKQSRYTPRKPLGGDEV
jgi:hypothetical protein